MTLNERERVLGIVTVALLVGFLSLLLLRPMVSRMRRSGDNLHAKDVELDAARGIVDRLDSIRDNYLAYEARLHSGRESTADLIAGINRLADSSGVDLTTSRPGEPETVQFYRELKITIGFEGDIGSVVRFLYSLLADPGILDVRRLVVRPKPNSDELLACEADVVSVEAMDTPEETTDARAFAPSI